MKASMNPVLLALGLLVLAVSCDSPLLNPDKAAVDSAGDTVQIVYPYGDNPSSVTNRIVLQTSFNGQSTTWTSDKPSIITSEGQVYPSLTGPEVVTLTATVSKGKASATKTFTLTVPQEPAAVAASTMELQLQPGDSLNSVTRYIDLAKTEQPVRAKAISVQWSSDTPASVDTTGRVYLSSGAETKVILTAKLSRPRTSGGSAVVTKTFNLTLPQGAVSPSLSELVGTWKRTTKNTGTAQDPAGTEADYVETVTTNLTITADANYVQKNVLLRTFSTGQSTTTYTDYRGTIRANGDTKDATLAKLPSDLLGTLYTLPTDSRTRTTGAFTDDSGWVALGGYAAYSANLSFTAFYKNQLFTDLAFTQGTYSSPLPTLKAAWNQLSLFGAILSEYFADGTFTSQFSVGSKEYKNQGTYTLAADGALTAAYTDAVTGKPVNWKGYSMVIPKFTGGGLAVYSFLYTGLLPPSEGAYTKQ